MFHRKKIDEYKKHFFVFSVVMIEHYGYSKKATKKKFN